MISQLFLDLLVLLGCAIIFGLICLVFAITWYAIKAVIKTAKEVGDKCSPVKTAQTDTSAAMQNAKNTNENEQSMNK